MSYISAAGYKVLPGKLYEHIVVAEEALRSKLPERAVVHHVGHLGVAVS